MRKLIIPAFLVLFVWLGVFMVGAILRVRAMRSASIVVCILILVLIVISIVTEKPQIIDYEENNKRDATRSN